MAYQGYELNSGDCLTTVAALCRHAARASGSFSSATVPTLNAVETYLTLSYYWIAGSLARCGFDTVQTDAEVLGILQQLQAYDVAMKVELSLPAENSGGAPNERFMEFKERRDELSDMICNGSLAAVGGSVFSNIRRVPLITGISISRKQVAESDSDRTQHRIRRNSFVNPSIGEPVAETDIGSSLI